MITQLGRTEVLSHKGRHQVLPSPLHSAPSQRLQLIIFKRTAEIGKLRSCSGDEGRKLEHRTGRIDTGDHGAALRETVEVTDAKTWKISKRGVFPGSQMVQKHQSRLEF